MSFLNFCSLITHFHFSVLQDSFVIIHHPHTFSILFQQQLNNAQNIVLNNQLICNRIGFILRAAKFHLTVQLYECEERSTAIILLQAEIMIRTKATGY